VLLNETGMSNDEIHTLCYEHSYQYIRATTPVSIHPAIYYAHLASNRAVPHDPHWQDSTSGQTTTQGPGPQAAGHSGSQSGSQPPKQGSKEQSSTAPQEVWDKLMPMPNTGGIQSSMWYI